VLKAMLTINNGSFPVY